MTVRHGAVLRLGLTILLFVLGVSGCTGNGSGSGDPAASAALIGSPCQSAGATRITHVVWILMENKASDRIVGSPSAPYLNALARRCGLASNDHGVAHPSLPNYIALTSGSTQGIRDDDNPSAHPLRVPSLFSQLDAARLSWKAYEEAMPGTCRRTNKGLYAVRHNPAAYYTRLTSCATQDVPYQQLAQDLTRGTLPSFSFVTPNLCHDMHNCSVSTGDAWLSQELPKIINSSAYRSGSTAVFIAWDEDDHTSGNRIPLFVVAPSVRPGTLSTTAIRHPALLDLTEQLLRLPALPGASGGTELRRTFGL